MNEEQTEVARALATNPRWTWREGTQPCAAELAPFVWGKLGRVEETGWDPQYCDDIAQPLGWPTAKREAWPDLTDDATGGVLWVMAGKPSVGLGVYNPQNVLVVEQVVRRPSGYKQEGATLAEACARLLLAQWAWEASS